MYSIGIFVDTFLFSILIISLLHIMFKHKQQRDLLSLHVHVIFNVSQNVAIIFVFSEFSEFKCERIHLGLWFRMPAHIFLVFLHWLTVAAYMATLRLCKGI